MGRARPRHSPRAEARAFPGPIHRWRETRDAILEDIFTHFWDDKRKTFVQHKGATTTDAAMLLMPLIKFISPHDPRWLSTMAAIERRHRPLPILDDGHSRR